MTILQGQGGARYGIWWEDPAFYTLYDDFNDASIDGSKWTTQGSVTETGGQVIISDSSGGSILESNNIPAGRSIWADFWINRSADDSGDGSGCSFGNSTDGWTELWEAKKPMNNFVPTREKGEPSGILILHKGGGIYDAYVGGDLRASGVSKPNGAQIQIHVNKSAFATTPRRCRAFTGEVRHSNA